MDLWREYYTYGGLPLIQSFETEEKKINYLKDLFETVYLADIIERHKIKNDNELRELVLKARNTSTRYPNTISLI